MLLADQGADVIKVEAPEGDAVRHIGKPGKTPGMGPTYSLRESQQALALASTSRTRRRARLS